MNTYCNFAIASFYCYIIILLYPSWLFLRPCSRGYMDVLVFNPRIPLSTVMCLKLRTVTHIRFIKAFTQILFWVVISFHSEILMEMIFSKPLLWLQWVWEYSRIPSGTFIPKLLPESRSIFNTKHTSTKRARQSTAAAACRHAGGHAVLGGWALSREACTSAGP